MRVRLQGDNLFLAQISDEKKNCIIYRLLYPLQVRTFLPHDQWRLYGGG